MVTRLRVGELFAGYSGLYLALEELFGPDAVELAWVSEYEPPTKTNPNPSQAPARILAHHYPHVRNYGDVTAIDWTTVEPVDVLTGGFPCQDVSTAGKQAGLKPGTRSGLWSHMAYAIDQLRPRLVVFENVRGLLSAEAHSDVEPCPWCLGDGDGVPALRAHGAVLGDLADIGYDARWCGLSASDIGACHGRFRVFGIAWPAQDAHRAAGREWGEPAPREAEGGWPRANAGRRGRAPAADAGRDPWTQDDENGAAAARSGRASAADAEHGGRPGRPHLTVTRPGRRAAAAGRGEGGDGREAATDADSRGLAVGKELDREPAQAATDRGARRGHVARRDHAVADADGDPVREQPVAIGGRSGPAESGHSVQWGPYEAAIRRWERALGRVAPPPTEPGRKGSPRLSPRFVEWMQGLDDGWVTGVPGVTRNDQLKALGNGVVPQQAAEALRRLLLAPAVDQAAGAAA